MKDFFKLIGYTLIGLFVLALILTYWPFFLVIAILVGIWIYVKKRESKENKFLESKKKPNAIINVVEPQKQSSTSNNNSIVIKHSKRKSNKRSLGTQLSNAYKDSMPSNATVRTISKINSDVLQLLYFKNGPRKNISEQTEEPSAIDITLPISFNKPQKIKYFPSYEDLSSAQRGYFLNWLETLNSVDDMGYPFLLLYCLERHIYDDNKVPQAVKTIKQLQQTFNNTSFNYYSSVAAVGAAEKYSNLNYLKGIDTSKLPTNVALFIKLSFKRKIDPDFIISRASDLHWTNKRYINKYPILFRTELIKHLIRRYDHPYFPAPVKINKENIDSSPLTLSNYSLPEDQRIIQFPDLLNADEVGIKLTASLMDAHKHVKKYLKNHPEEYKSSDKTHNRTFNANTDNPVAKKSSIERTRQQLDSIPNIDQDISNSKKRTLLESAQQFGTNGARMSLERYGHSLYIYNFTLGEQLYKQGDWDKAEQTWLPLLVFNPSVAENIAKLYRKQHRYKDEIHLLELAIKEWIHSPFNTYHSSPQELNDRLQKAKFKTHKQEDKSKGFIYKPKYYDKEFANSLTMLIVQKKPQHQKHKSRER
jgi:hypothetical protein